MFRDMTYCSCLLVFFTSIPHSWTITTGEHSKFIYTKVDWFQFKWSLFPVVPAFWHGRKLFISSKWNSSGGNIGLCVSMGSCFSGPVAFSLLLKCSLRGMPAEHRLRCSGVVAFYLFFQCYKPLKSVCYSGFL